MKLRAVLLVILALAGLGPLAGGCAIEKVGAVTPPAAPTVSLPAPGPGYAWYRNALFRFALIYPKSWEIREGRYVGSPTGHFEGVAKFSSPTLSAGPVKVSLNADHKASVSLADMAYSFLARAKLLAGFRKMGEVRRRDRVLLEYSFVKEESRQRVYGFKAFVLRKEKPNLFTFTGWASSHRDYRVARSILLRMVLSFRMFSSH